MIDPYTHQVVKPQKNRKRTIKRLVIVIVSTIVVAAITFGALYVWRQQTLSDEVKTELKKVPALLEATRKDGGGYPGTITTAMLPSSENVTFLATGSFDGTAYCVTGTSKQDNKIVYYIASSNTEPQPGSCSDAKGLSKPLTPNDLAVQSTYVDQLSLSWAPSTYAGSYTLECSTNTDFTESVASTTVQATSGVCKDLTSSTRYYTRVKANNTSGESAWSRTLEASTNEMSVAPIDLTGTRLSKSEVGYSWSKVAGAQKYIVELALDNNFMEGVVSQTLPATKTSTTFGGLKPYTAYYLHVKAVTADFDETKAAFSNETLVRTLQE